MGEEDEWEKKEKVQGIIKFPAVIQELGWIGILRSLNQVYRYVGLKGKSQDMHLKNIIILTWEAPI